MSRPFPQNHRYMPMGYCKAKRVPRVITRYMLNQSHNMGISNMAKTSEWDSNSSLVENANMPSKYGFKRIVIFLIFAQLIVVLIAIEWQFAIAYSFVASEWAKGSSTFLMTSMDDIRYSLPTDFLGSIVVDVHKDDLLYGHTYHDDLHDVSPVVNQTSIAIGLAITSKKLSPDLRSWPFFISLMDSFCKTASNGYNYNFFLAYDFTDEFFRKMSNIEGFASHFMSVTFKLCPKRSKYSIHFVQCSHNGHPAQAQNDAMMAAYMHNMAYYYRVNDDTLMKSAKWTDIFIAALREFDPENTGVVGPDHQNGNVGILTYDFVHITHINLFGFYYPRVFTDWYGDAWISSVYKPGRVLKVKKVHLVHTMSVGMRYKVQAAPRALLKPAIKDGQTLIKRYVRASLRNAANRISPDARKVIAMSLYGENPEYTYGAIRNAQLMPVHFPEWILHVYVVNPQYFRTTENMQSYNLEDISNYTDTNHSDDQRGMRKLNKKFEVPRLILNKLKTLGASIRYIDNETAINLHPNMWRYLSIDEDTATHILIRDARHRISAKDSYIVKKWMRGTDHPNKISTIMCTKDNELNSKHVLPPGGFISFLNKDLKQKLNLTTTFVNYAHRWSQKTLKPLSEEMFLSDIVAPALTSEYKAKFPTEDILCYDSITCDTSNYSVPFPVTSSYMDFIGQVYNMYDEPQHSKQPISECIVNISLAIEL